MGEEQIIRKENGDRNMREIKKVGKKNQRELDKINQDKMAPLYIPCVYIYTHTWKIDYCVMSEELYVFHVIY